MARTLDEINRMGEAWVDTLVDVTKEQKNTSQSVKDYTALLNKLELMFKPLIDGATAQAKATKDIADAQKEATQKAEENNKVLREQTENYLDATAETQRFKDGLMEVRRQITEVTHVTKGMDKSSMDSRFKTSFRNRFMVCSKCCSWCY